MSHTRLSILYRGDYPPVYKGIRVSLPGEDNDYEDFASQDIVRDYKRAWEFATSIGGIIKIDLSIDNYLYDHPSFVWKDVMSLSDDHNQVVTNRLIVRNQSSYYH